MKAKKIVAVVMGAALAGTLAIGMSACAKKGPKSLGTTTTFNVANYAEKYEYGNNSNKGFTSAKTLFSGKEYVSTLRSGYYVLESNEKYSVYDIKAEKEIISNLSFRPQAITLGYTGTSLNVISVRTSKDNVNECAYYAYDGTQILAAGEYEVNSMGISGVYVGNDTKPCTVYAVMGVKAVVKDEVPDVEEVEIYLKAVTDEDTQLTSYSKINKSDIKTYAPDYAVGGDQSGLARLIYDDEDYPVEGEIKDYKIGVIGKKYTFYKGNEKTGTVEINNGEAVGIMNGCFYYREDKMVVEGDHAGYNFVSFGEGSDLKSTSTLYKYDIVANTTTELNYDVAVERLIPLYNHETKSCDAAIISGYKMVDGVAMEGMNSFTYIIDKDFNLAYDMTGIFYGTPYLYDIGGDKYYIGTDSSGYIVDGELNVLSRAYGMDSIYVDESLMIVYSNVSGQYAYGFKDLSGKVVIAPEYSTESGSPVFYNGVAYVYGTDGAVLLKKDGTVTKISDLEKSTDKKVTKEVTVRNGYYTLTTVTEVADGDDKVEVAFYAFDGTLLKSFAHDDVDVMNVSGSTLIRETVTDATTQEVTYTYYKLV